MRLIERSSGQGALFIARGGVIDTIWISCEPEPGSVKTVEERLQWESRIEYGLEWVGLLYAADQKAREN
jgi:hypothetical protein